MLAKASLVVAAVLLPVLPLLVASWLVTTRYAPNHSVTGEAATASLITASIGGSLWLVVRCWEEIMKRIPAVAARRRTAMKFRFAMVLGTLGSLGTLLLSHAFAYASLFPRLASNCEPIVTSDALKVRAKALWGHDLDPGGANQVCRHSFLGMDVFALAIPLPPGKTYLSGNQEFSYGISGDLFEEYGWPFRAIRTPLTHGGATRPNFDQVVEELPIELANLHIVPMAFAMDALLLACLMWGLWRGPRRLRAIVRDCRGQCVQCGYVLKGLPRCPECGTPANA